MYLQKWFSLFYFLCFIINIGIYSQGTVKGKVIEKDTKLPIAFASITYQKNNIQKGVISDVNGKFEIQESDIQSITASCVGYKMKKTIINPETDLLNVVVELENNIVEINEVVITPKNNPAIRIIKNVLGNKTKNNYEGYDKYQYRCYFKTTIDLKLSNSETAQDSLTILKNYGLIKSAGLLSETVATCIHNKNNTINKIIANKTSGFKDPIFGQTFLAVFHNSISFYNNTISLFELPLTSDKSVDEYVSPFSSDCLNNYDFKLEDRYINAKDSIFVVDFSPKKGKNFNSLKGRIFISSNGYAIKNILAEPNERGLLDFKFRQDYELINNKWFPSNLDEEISWNSVKIKHNINAHPVYIIESRIDNVDYNPVIDKESVKLEKVYIDPTTITKSDSIINSARSVSLTERERNTYYLIDSIGQKHHFDYIPKLISKLSVGRIPFKVMDLDINSVYNYNEYEGSRLGLGLYSNETVSNFITFGGFTGYGFRDERYKYGSQVQFNINHDHDIQFMILYQNNLKEAGFDIINDYSVLSLGEYLRSFIGFRYDLCVEKKFEFSFRSFRFFKISAALSLKDLRPTYNYEFKGTPLNGYEADEVQINAKFAYGEELSAMGNQRVITYEGNPIINIAFKRGINLFNNQSYIYNRVEATLDFTAYKGTLGQSDIRLAAGLVDKSLPYGLMFTGEGSNNNTFPVIINHSFQTMSPYEFLSDKYFNIFYSHNFGSLLFKTPGFKPQFVIAENCGWGTLKNPSYQDIDFKIKNKIYYESGLIINNIIKLNYLKLFYFGFGLGTFYRYGYYGYNNFMNNLALKLSVNLTLK